MIITQFAALSVISDWVVSDSLWAGFWNGKQQSGRLLYFKLFGIHNSNKRQNDGIVHLSEGSDNYLFYTSRSTVTRCKFDGGSLRPVVYDMIAKTKYYALVR